MWRLPVGESRGVSEKNLTSPRATTPNVEPVASPLRLAHARSLRLGPSVPEPTTGGMRRERNPPQRRSLRSHGALEGSTVGCASGVGKARRDASSTLRSRRNRNGPSVARNHRRVGPLDQLNTSRPQSRSRPAGGSLFYGVLTPKKEECTILSGRGWLETKRFHSRNSPRGPLGERQGLSEASPERRALSLYKSLEKASADAQSRRGNLQQTKR